MDDLKSAPEPENKPPEVTPERKLPSRIMITSLHGFITEDGRHRQWHGGEIIDNPHEIALLTERKALFEVL
jgi:hypothetical protein